MPKTNRKPGIHLHRTTVQRKNGYKVTATEEWFWILIAKNGKTIARSSESYKTKRAAIRSMKVTAEIFTGHKPIEYFDHTGKNGVELVEF